MGIQERSWCRGERVRFARRRPGFDSRFSLKHLLQFIIRPLSHGRQWQTTMSILLSKPLHIRRSESALKGGPMWLCEHVNTHHSHMRRGRLRPRFGHGTLMIVFHSEVRNKSEKHENVTLAA